MKRTYILLFFLAAFSTATVYAQKVDLIFSHKFHAEEVGADCIACHALAEESVVPVDNMLPEMETCYQCHDEDTECSVCHQDPENAEAFPRITTYIAKFPHATHMANGAECLTCHAGVDKSDNVMERHLPAMAQCQTCHTEVEKTSYCTDCHTASEDLRPADHKMDWLKSHGLVSQLNDNCASCHSENTCLTCHQGDNLDRTVHPLNFINNHSLSAKANKDNCYTCHEELSFCSDCHREQLVLPRNHSTAGWSNLSNGGRHAREAKIDLDTCLSCHNDTTSEPICAQCHSSK